MDFLINSKNRSPDYVNNAYILYRNYTDKTQKTTTNQKNRPTLIAVHFEQLKHDAIRPRKVNKNLRRQHNQVNFLGHSERETLENDMTRVRGREGESEYVRRMRMTM